MNLINFFDSSSSNLPNLNANNSNSTLDAGSKRSNDIVVVVDTLATVPDYQDKYYSIIEEENKQKLRQQLEQEKERLKSLMPNLTFNLVKNVKDDYETCSNSLIQNTTNLNIKNVINPIVNITQSIPLTPTPNNVVNTSGALVNQQLLLQQSNTINLVPNTITSNNYYLNDANKAFDDVVFDILKVDPDYIAGQLTLIDVPLFKAIEPDELISCKWMSREKLVKAPNIVHFTRRFNQTTFWCQKEILNCKRIEKRGKMITHFIKIAKRLNELHSFNCLMAIIVALKSAPIFRLKKTWSQHVSKRDTSQFERLADLMFDTSDNKRKIRDMHMNCKLPCIPFLGLFLTDLIHIDIAHPHNSFDNPQRRNQMNNICRLISEYQQSNYQDLTSISCSCTFTSTPSSTENNTNNDDINNSYQSTNSNNSPNGGSNTNGPVCLVNNCSCGIHHGNGYGAGIINSDGTIYISEITYVHNYLNSFLYIEELQKFKEDENYRDSLELEPEPTPTPTSTSNNSNTNNTQALDHLDHKLLMNDSLSLTPSMTTSVSSPNKNHDDQLKITNVNGVTTQTTRFTNGGALTSYNSVIDSKKQIDISNCNNSGTTNLGLNFYHRKSLSLNNNNLLNETKEFLNELKLKHHPLDDSIVESTSNLPVLTTVACANVNTNNGNSNTLNNVNNESTSINNQSTNNNATNTSNINNASCNMNDLNLYLNLTKEQQKQILNSVKLNDPPSLLKELLKHRHNNILSINNNNLSTSSDNNQSSNGKCTHHKNHHKKSSNNHNNHHKNKFNCYSANTASSDDCDCDCDETSSNSKNLNGKNNNEQDVNNNLNDLDLANNEITLTSTSTPSKSTSTGKNSHTKQKSLNTSLTLFSPNLKNLNENVKDTDNENQNLNFVENSNGNGSARRISGRNLIKVLNESEKIQNNNNNNATNTFNSNSLTTSTISYGNNLENSLNSMSNINEDNQSNDLSLSNNLLLNNILLQTSIIQFESPVKRKCIIKNYRKPRFSQWKSYWLQLVGGNLLIYYPAKTLVFNRGEAASNQRRNSTNSNEFYSDAVTSAIATHTAASSTAPTNTDPCVIFANEQSIIDEELKQQQIQQLQNQLQSKKVFYHKNPCKMHPIASWMVVNLYQDKENEMILAVNQALVNNQPMPQHINNHTKFDIQLNDLNNGNMYKYRFDSLPLAKHWLDQFKLASTYHERQKPDNLIRFD